jgi:hypothetical protein
MRKLTGNDWRAILIFTGSVVLGAITMSIYKNDQNAEYRGKRGLPLYARFDLWRDDRPEARVPAIKSTHRVDGLLHSTENDDILIRYRGQYLVSNLEFFSLDPVLL